MAFTYFLILWSTAWSPSRLCESEERKQTELVSPAKRRRRSPQPSWPLEKAAALPCRCAGQRPSSRGWERSRRHPRDTGVSSPSPARPVVPAALAARPGFGCPRRGGFEQEGSRGARGSARIPAASSNHGKCLPASLRGSFNQGRDKASRSTNTPARPRHPTTHPHSAGPGQRPLRVPSSSQGSTAEPKTGPTRRDARQGPKSHQSRINAHNPT